MSFDEAQAAAAMFGGTSPSSPSAQAAPTNSAQAAEADLAARLFGGASAHQPPEKAEERPPRTDEEMEHALYPKKAEPVNLAPVPEEVQALREAQERKMFSAQDMLKDVIRDSEFKSAELDPEVAKRGIVEVREIAADLGLGKAEIEALKDRATAVRVQPIPESQQVDATISALNREFGNDARQALMDARALVGRDPRVGRIIEAMGIGNDPAVVVMLAKQARSQIAAGHLRGKGAK